MCAPIPRTLGRKKGNQIVRESDRGGVEDQAALLLRTLVHHGCRRYRSVRIYHRTAGATTRGRRATSRASSACHRSGATHHVRSTRAIHTARGTANHGRWTTTQKTMTVVLVQLMMQMMRVMQMSIAASVMGRR